MRAIDCDVEHATRELSKLLDLDSGVLTRRVARYFEVLQRDTLEELAHTKAKPGPPLALSTHTRRGKR
ncbi:MAG: hypothetical protein AAF735_03520 [Myxococcota bacterium]